VAVTPHTHVCALGEEMPGVEIRGVTVDAKRDGDAGATDAERMGGVGDRDTERLSPKRSSGEVM
jgi:hypothetical protein